MSEITIQQDETLPQETTEIQEERKPKMDDKGRSYATGKRKNAIARVWIQPGKGKFTINKLSGYFKRPTLQMMIEQPFEVVDRVGQFDVIATAKGGGLSGQAGAIRHAIAKALNLYEPSLRPILKKEGLLTRDARIVERKKYGRRKARRGQQWAKR